MTMLAHSLNNLDWPYDLSSNPPGSGGDASKFWDTSSEVKVLTLMSGKARNQYYLRTIDAMNFTTFDINRLSSLKEVVSVPFTRTTNPLDGTALLLQAAEEQNNGAPVQRSWGPE